ncbi:peptidase inhibitor 16 [Austrofundulus limnaeus]|uniref:Peptidase inhibitor 16 n=1 Tax=Austrofundulus limnaeus TaxID=52670 RepID=A0A2I4AM43_AUSLI|nr:PREDICTED: peptidase inhibitor 16-like [Austrofundulus limnaeus]
MLPLKWDSGLKLIAEAYAAKCIWNHNPELEETGENLYAGTGALDLRVAVEKWFMERLYYDFQNNSCDEDKMCGHYTQMVWADTHRVGCAIHSCNSMEGLDWDQRTSFLVCNYYPAGNYEGERPYVEGDWCSRCPENLQKCENNLCVDDDFSEDYNETSSPPQPPEGTSAGPTDAPMEPDPPLVQTEPTEDEHMTPPEPRTTGVWFKGQNILSSTLSPHEEEAGQIEEAGQVKDTELTEEVGQVKGAELTEEVGQVKGAELTEEVGQVKGAELTEEVGQVKGEGLREEAGQREEPEENVLRKEEPWENLETKSSVGSGSGSVPSVLFVCLTAVLGLRL